MKYITHRPSERERLVHSAHRFAKISRNDPVKLFCLLYMLDIRLFREDGQSCTGEVYYAMADGPAPGTLRSLLVMRDWDLDAAIAVLTSTDFRRNWSFDPGRFCPHGLDIINELENAYGEANARDLALDDANAWWSVYTQSRGVGAVIPYELTMPCVPAGSALDESGEAKRLMRKFRVSDVNLPNYRDSFKPAMSPD